jgi:hypothetical protein
VGTLDTDGMEEGGDQVGVLLGRVRSGRFAALARARQVERDTAEVFGVGGKLERVAGVIRGQVWDQQKRLTLALDVIVDLQSVDLDNWHRAIS